MALGISKDRLSFLVEQLIIASKYLTDESGSPVSMPMDTDAAYAVAAEMLSRYAHVLKKSDNTKLVVRT